MNISFQLKTPLLCVFLFAAIVPARADVIELTNGDHYRGTVVGMTTSDVDFLSEIQGRVKLPRDKVAQIILHPVTPTSSPTNPVTSLSLTAPRKVGASSGSTNNIILTGEPKAVLEQMRQQGVDPKLVSQVQEQVIGKSSPEAAQKFNELLGGLTSGSLSFSDIRAQAQNSIKEIKEAKKELGKDADGMLDGYLDILQKFVQETDSPTTAPAPSK